MSETLIRRLRGQAGLTNRAAAAKAGIHSGQLSRIEAGEHGLSVKTAEKLGAAYGVDPMALMVAQGFDAMRAQAQQGEISPREVAQKGAQLLSLASDTPGLLSESEFQRFVKIGQEIHQLAEKAATKARIRATKADTQALAGRDGLGRAHKSKATGGVRSAYATGFPADKPTGFQGGGRPESAAVAPAVRGFVDAVADLEERLADPRDITVTEEPGSILGAVSQILGQYSEVDLAGDPDAKDALKRLQKLAASGSGQVAATKRGASGTAALDELANRRGPGGVATKKRYGS